MKSCKVGNYSKKMKTILDKIQENSKFIQNKRAKCSFGVRDLEQIATFEIQLKGTGTPLTKYYDTFKSVKEVEKSKKAAASNDKKPNSEVPLGDEEFEEVEEIEKSRENKKRKKPSTENKSEKKRKPESVQEGDSEDEEDEVKDFDDFSDDE